MSGPIISARNVSKRYFIGHEMVERGKYTALRDIVSREAKNLIRKTGDLLRGRQILSGDVVEEFWALKDVSFDVAQGEVLGIIGRNGAGKTTLLKILSRITDPTEGRIALRGRVASLLEVGTGFHPELTGRENIFLNGAILGMMRADIRRRFDEIVSFAAVEEFVDTPVKRYSSGMYVRLAFAVAAHLEPDILIVDEVLAVGDVEFQKKCIGKMDESAKEGRTVLFVSHDMRRAAALCRRGLLLESGRIKCYGDISNVIETYLAAHMQDDAFSDLTERNDRSGSGEARFVSIELLKNGQQCRTFSMGDPFAQTIRVRFDHDVPSFTVGVTISTSDGIRVYQFMSCDEGCEWNAEIGEYVFTVSIDCLLLYPGSYFVDLWLGDRNFARVDYIVSAISFVVSHDHGIGIDRHLDRTSALVHHRSGWRLERETGAPPGSGSPRFAATEAY